MKKYLQIPVEDVKLLMAGEEVEICIGNKIKRMLTTKSVFEIKKAALEEKHQARLAKLASQEGAE